MSHIDEGELTAYADGAWAPEDAEAIRIAAHLAECANCRNRLAQEQALSGRASEILAVAAPVMAGAPTFEEVAARIPPRMHSRRRALPLSWAASIILAVGIGWYGRDVLYRPQSASESAPIEPTQRASAGAGASDVAVETSTASREATRAAEPQVVAAAPPPAPQATTEVASAAGIGAANAMRTREQDAAPEEIVADMASVAERRDIEYITAAEAEKRNLPMRVVPELEIVRVGVLNGAVQVEQKLPDGVIVTVTAHTGDDRGLGAAAGEASETRAARQDAGVEGGRATSRTERTQSAAKQAAPAPALAPATPAPSLARKLTVVVAKGTTTVTINGSLSADSLRALAAKIR